MPDPRVGVVAIIHECWMATVNAGAQWCRKPVDPMDDLGLCEDHLEELRSQ